MLRVMQTETAHKRVGNHHVALYAIRYLLGSAAQCFKADAAAAALQCYSTAQAVPIAAKEKGDCAQQGAD